MNKKKLKDKILKQCVTPTPHRRDIMDKKKGGYGSIAIIIGSLKRVAPDLSPGLDKLPANVIHLSELPLEGELPCGVDSLKRKIVELDTYLAHGPPRAQIAVILNCHPQTWSRRIEKQFANNDGERLRHDCLDASSCNEVPQPKRRYSHYQSRQA
ncbi:hypothetical protein JHK82_055512 [Glycine max]|nr:hypothetical protein JHK82_055512 [Glycine max]